MNPQKDTTDLERFDDVSKRIAVLEAQLEALEEAKAKVDVDSKLAQEMIAKGIDAEAVFEWFQARDYGIEPE